MEDKTAFDRDALEREWKELMEKMANATELSSLRAEGFKK